MKLIIVRHAEPDYARDSLTEKGWREAELLSRRLTRLENVEGWYVSPLGRARDTASVTLRKIGAEAEVLPWLHEFRGETVDPETGKLRLSWDYRPQLWKPRRLLHDSEHWLEDEWMIGSNVGQIWRETTEGTDALLARHGYRRDGVIYRCGNNRRGAIVCFCHFGVGAAMAAYVLGMAPMELMHCFSMQPSAVTTLITEERTRGEVVFRCLQLGDLSHLWAAGEPYSTAGLYAEVYDGRDSTAPVEWET